MSDALKRLIDAVEAGSIRSKFDPAFERAIYPQVKAMSTVYLAGEAYCGSLDAAKDLHEALLPGWRCEINWKPGEAADACVSNGSGDEIEWGDAQQSASAARTWLLAILRAKLSEAKNHPRQETSD